MSVSLQPHGLQHARLPCPSAIPRACSSSCPLSQWCHPAISSPVIPLSSHLQSFPASGSKLVITLLPRSKCRLMSRLQSPSLVIWETKKINKVCHCSHCFPIYLPWSDGMTFFFFFGMLSFKLAFWLSSFTFIKRLLSPSSLSAIRMVSSAYLRLLIFLPAILIPVCALSSQAFHNMYSAYKLNKLGDKYRFDVLLSQFWTNLLLHIQV